MNPPSSGRKPEPGRTQEPSSPGTIGRRPAPPDDCAPVVAVVDPWFDRPVRTVASPVNTTSVAIHRALGFAAHRAGLGRIVFERSLL
jgi:hypothetical protein